MSTGPIMPPPPGAAEATTSTKPWWKRWWGILLIVFAALLILGAFAAALDGDVGEDSAADGEAAPDTQESEQAPVEAPDDEADEPEPAPEAAPEVPAPEPEDETEPEDAPESEPAPEEPVSAFGDGTHRVDEDIDPGTYRSTGSSLCYWARLSGFGGELDDIIANGNSPMEIVTIDGSDAGFETTGCGGWVAGEDSYPDAPADSFADGTYVVGEHIEPGTYRADGGPDELCYWARLSSFSHAGIDGIITNGNNPTVIEIAPSDAGFTAQGCGTWSR